MHPYSISVFNHNDLTGNLIHSILKLIHTTWPSTYEEAHTSQVFPEINKVSSVFEKHLICFEGAKVVGYAKVFERIIFIDTLHIRNLALASLCVDPPHQQKGCGSLLAQKAFSFVDSKEFDCAIFQTSRKQFYERLNCRKVSDKCFDTSHSQKNWWDEHIMLYPSSFEISGPIQMNGPAY